MTYEIQTLIDFTLLISASSVFGLAELSPRSKMRPNIIITSWLYLALWEDQLAARRGDLSYGVMNNRAPRSFGGHAGSGSF